MSNFTQILPKNGLFWELNTSLYRLAFKRTVPNDGRIKFQIEVTHD